MLKNTVNIVAINACQSTMIIYACCGTFITGMWTP